MERVNLVLKAVSYILLLHVQGNHVYLCNIFIHTSFLLEKLNFAAPLRSGSLGKKYLSFCCGKKWKKKMLKTDECWKIIYKCSCNVFISQEISAHCLATASSNTTEYMTIFSDSFSRSFYPLSHILIYGTIICFNTFVTLPELNLTAKGNKYEPQFQPCIMVGKQN